VIRVRQTLVPLLTAWLALAGVARAVPKCHVYELTVEGVSLDGRYALTTSNDHFGLVDVELIDLKDGSTALDATVGETEFEAVDLDELLKVGRRVTLRPAADWGWHGSWSKLRGRLQARCGPVELPAQAQKTDVHPGQVRGIYVGTSYAAVTFDLGPADGCDSTTGEVVAAVPCGKTGATEQEEPDRRLILESGTPPQVLAAIAANVYRGRHDPLGAYRLVSLLAGNLTPATTSPEVLLAIDSDETLYLSQLGWLGRARCLWLERTAAGRLGAVWKSPPSPAAVRLKQAALFNMQKCHPQPGP
jgi:hypothetical protein